MNGLLLATGLAFARRNVGEAMHRTMLGVAAYVILLVCALIATGFFTAAGFMYLVETLSAIQTCVVIAGVYALIGVIGFLVLLLMRNRRHQSTTPPAIMPAAGSADISASEGFPGGIASIGLLAAAGYLMGRSMTRKR
jgi:hypothetical protein